MFNLLSKRKVSFELLAISKELGARIKFVPLLELEKLGFKRSTLTETVKYLSSLGYLEHDLKGNIKITNKVWCERGEKFINLNSTLRWKLLLTDVSLVTLWNTQNFLLFQKKLINKKNKKFLKFTTNPKKLNAGFTIINTNKTLWLQELNSKCLKFLKGNKNTILKCFKMLTKIYKIYFLYKKSKNKTNFTSRYLILKKPFVI
ncbi:hypothetical protein BCF89_1092 [Metamycoplasma auris]|nr:hypothetical protein [Metamycoplasma auris]PZV99234.1 hypothetical protein BCF89_1092 [Metamycoplasma auris]